VTPLVFDNTPLSHFARAGVLPVLESLVAKYQCITLAEVSRELLTGLPQHPALSAALALPWLEVRELTEIEEIVKFAGYKTELGGGIERNNGESAVLAWTAVHGGIALIDERAATRIAKRDGIEVHGTLWLVTNGIRGDVLSKEVAARIIDQLRDTDMSLPVDGAGLLQWAEDQGLLP
jgi:predicted nucleic acid-binding protein